MILTWYAINNGNSYIDSCNQKNCHFIVSKKNKDNYKLIIKNLDKKVDINTKIYILQYNNKNFDFSNLTSHYFLSDFEFNFRLDPQYSSNVTSTKELVINYISPKNPDQFNIQVSYVNQSDYKYKIEQRDGRNYIHYYYNLDNKQINSDILINIKGTWPKNLFSEPDKVSLSYEGPFYINIQNDYISKKINYIEGNNIYFSLEKPEYNKYI